MSWIVDIAGRAENILNNIDKNAANVLQHTSIRLSEEWANPKIKKNENTDTTSNILDDSIKLISSTNTGNKITNVADSIPANSDPLPLPSLKDLNNINAVSVSVKSKQNYKKKKFNKKPIEKKILVNNDEELSNFETKNNEIIDKSIIIDSKDKIDESNEKIQQLENDLENITKEKNSINDKLIESSNENKIYVAVISELEISLKKSQKQYMEINEKLNIQNKECSQIKFELDNYRKKAQSTLQLKDELIERLKNNSNITVKQDEIKIDFEINSLKEENLKNINDLKHKLYEIENRDVLIKELNQQINDLNSKYENTISSLTNRLTLEQNKSIQFESQIKVINHEMHTLRQELNKQNQSFLQKIHKKENEIMTLQSKMTKTNDTNDLNTTEGKIKSLTKYLFEKQAAVESLTVERNELKLQLEKVQEQLNCVIKVNRPQRSQIINVNDTDDDKSQLPLILKENPFDTQVARRVKRAYTSFDSAGIRIGVFLRRYPLIRIMVFAYIALLHIWVMFVLLSTTPT